jgi:hypothetical protein
MPFWEAWHWTSRSPFKCIIIATVLYHTRVYRKCCTKYSHCVAPHKSLPEYCNKSCCPFLPSCCTTFGGKLPRFCKKSTARAHITALSCLGYLVSMTSCTHFDLCLLKSHVRFEAISPCATCSRAVTIKAIYTRVCAASSLLALIILLSPVFAYLSAQIPPQPMLNPRQMKARYHLELPRPPYFPVHGQRFIQMCQGTQGTVSVNSKRLRIACCL